MPELVFAALIAALTPTAMLFTLIADKFTLRSLPSAALRRSHETGHRKPPKDHEHGQSKIRVLTTVARYPEVSAPLPNFNRRCQCEEPKKDPGHFQPQNARSLGDRSPNCLAKPLSAPFHSGSLALRLHDAFANLSPGHSTTIVCRTRVWRHCRIGCLPQRLAGLSRPNPKCLAEPNPVHKSSLIA